MNLVVGRCMLHNRPPVCLLVTGTDARVPVGAPRLAAGPQPLHLGCNMLLPNTSFRESGLERHPTLAGLMAVIH